MNKLYTHIKLLSFFILISAKITQGMELPITQLQSSQQQSSVKSLRHICIESIVFNSKKTNLVDNLVNLPVDCAVNIMLHPLFYMTLWNEDRKKIVELAKKAHTLDNTFACALVYAVGHSEYMYNLAKQCPITINIASKIIEEALYHLRYDKEKYNVDILFPSEILQHGNDTLFYHLLMNKIVCSDGNPCRGKYEMSFKENEIGIFSDKDFELYSSKDTELTLCKEKISSPNVSIQKLIDYAKESSANETINYRCKDGFFTLSQCKHFLAIAYDYSFSGPSCAELHNLKTGRKIRIQMLSEEEVFLSMDKLIFNKDCSYIGILDTKGTIHVSNKIPMMLLKNELSLKQIIHLSRYIGADLSNVLDDYSKEI